jgi:hypothetical protein
MWRTQPVNSHMVCATIADNVIHLTSYRKTGRATKSAQKTTSQKSRSLNPLNLRETPLLFTNLALIGWNQWLSNWLTLVTAPFKALEALTAAPICARTQNYKTSSHTAVLVK